MNHCEACWKIGLSAWNIQDGNYPDFYVCQEIDFAVRFYAPQSKNTKRFLAFGKSDIRPSHSESLNIKPIGEDKYIINGKTVFSSPKGWIVDIGILVLEDGAPEWAETGDYICGEVKFEVDWYTADEILSRIPEAPPLVYTWRIEQIKIWDSNIKAFDRELQRTDAWSEEEQHAEYLLICTKLDIEPDRNRWIWE